MDFSSPSEDLKTLYKLIVLYILNKVAFPLTNSQISDFILEKGYTNYFTFSQVISELSESNLIQTRTLNNRTQVIITEEGETTLEYFGNRIGSEIRHEIDTYLKDKSFELRNEVSVIGEYYKTVNGDYEASLTAKDNNTVLVNIKLSVPTPQMAEVICNKWQEKNLDIYQYLTKELF